MPRLVKKRPKYRLHKASGQAIVSLGGRDHYLGAYGTRASRAEYDRLIGEWLLNGRRALVAQEDNGPLVAELAADYLEFALGYYQDRKTGEPTRSIDRVRTVVRLLSESYGQTDAAAFGPLALQAIQQRLIDEGKSRPYVNQLSEGIKRVFRWAVSREMIPPSVFQAVSSVPGLRKGRTGAREPEPVKPVSDEIVEATLPCLPPPVADMVRLQRLTGARPGEVCLIRPCDVDRSQEVWAYRPASHKTEHHGRKRTIFIGPKAQAILLPYLLRDAAAYCFCPRESEHRHNAARREGRRTPMTPSQAGRRRKRKPQRAPGAHYSVGSYARAITRGADKAFGKICGPVPRAELLALLEAGKLQTCDVVRRKGKKNWQTSGSLTPQASARNKRATRPRDDADEWFYMETAHRWTPNQLRHAAGTEIRRKFGLEAAQVILGHSKADVTQIYAERDMAKAAAVIREVG